MSRPHSGAPTAAAFGRLRDELWMRMGADASLVRQSDEDWVVVFNPQIIQRWERVPPDADVWDLPRIER